MGFFFTDNSSLIKYDMNLANSESLCLVPEALSYIIDYVVLDRYSTSQWGKDDNDDDKEDEDKNMMKCPMKKEDEDDENDGIFDELGFPSNPCTLVFI